MKDSKKVDILIESDFELSLFGDISADICFKEGAFITQDGDKINTTLNKLFRAKITLKNSGNKMTLKIINDYYGSDEGKEYRLAVIN